MATERQIEANRRNAQKSTGPKSDEGKDTSRRNACQHGLAGAGVIVPEPEHEIIARRAAEWAGVLRPVNGLESFFVLQLATESVRVERCQGDERVLIDLYSERAADPDGWDEDRRLEAEETAARLPRDPARTVRRLRQTAQGCDWLLARWESLGRSLDSGRPWDDARRSLALDLLGTAKEFREGPTPADPGPGEGDVGVAPQRALVAVQVAALTRLRSGVLVERDAAERETAELGVVSGEGPALRTLARLRRYEAACQRRLERALRQLLSGRLLRIDTGTASASKPAAVPAAPTERPAVPTPAPAPAPTPPARPTVSASDSLSAPNEPAPMPAPPAPVAADAPRGNRRWRRQQQRLARHNAA